MAESFFTGRLGSDVIRIAPDGRESLFNITSHKMAMYLFSLQAHGYKYKAPVRVHNRLEPCESCSA